MGEWMGNEWGLCDQQPVICLRVHDQPWGECSIQLWKGYTVGEQVDRAVLKPHFMLQLFWEKRLQGLNACDITEQTFKTLELPKNITCECYLDRSTLSLAKYIFNYTKKVVHINYSQEGEKVILMVWGSTPFNDF